MNVVVHASAVENGTVMLFETSFQGGKSKLKPIKVPTSNQTETLVLRSTGGNGGNGGDGSEGARGRDGKPGNKQNLQSGNGGDGSNGGNGGNAGRGGNGGEICLCVASHDMDIVMVLEEHPVYSAGVSGQPGSAGAGGRGGKGGPAFRYDEPIYNGDGYVGSHYYDIKAGKAGKKGRDGYDGKPASNGTPGKFSILVDWGTGNVKSYKTPYHCVIAMPSVSQLPVTGNGIIEPGVVVNTLFDVVNEGGMPTPVSQALFFGVHDNSWVQFNISGDCFAMRSSLAPGHRTSVSLRWMVTPRTSPILGNPLRAYTTLDYFGVVERVNRPFWRMKDQKSSVLVQHPVHASIVSGPSVVLRGDEAPLGVCLQNVSACALGSHASNPRHLSLALTVELIAEGLSKSSGTGDWATLVGADGTRAGDKLVVSKSNMAAHSAPELTWASLSISNAAPFYSRFKICSSLQLGDVNDFARPSAIQERFFEVLVSEPFQHDPNSEVLLVTNNRTTGAEVKAWREVCRLVFGATVSAWNLDLYNGVSMEQPLAVLGGDNMFAHFRGRLVVALNNQTLQMEARDHAALHGRMDTAEMLRGSLDHATHFYVLGSPSCIDYDRLLLPMPSATVHPIEHSSTEAYLNVARLGLTAAALGDSVFDVATATSATASSRFRAPSAGDPHFCGFLDVQIGRTGHPVGQQTPYFVALFPSTNHLAFYKTSSDADRGREPLDTCWLVDVRLFSGSSSAMSALEGHDRDRAIGEKLLSKQQKRLSSSSSSSLAPTVSGVGLANSSAWSADPAVEELWLAAPGRIFVLRFTPKCEKLNRAMVATADAADSANSTNLVTWRNELMAVLSDPESNVPDAALANAVDQMRRRRSSTPTAAADGENPPVALSLRGLSSSLIQVISEEEENIKYPARKLSALPGTTFSGLLRKQAGTGRGLSFNIRWFVLHGSTLHYYASEASTRPKVSIRLDRLQVHDVCPTEGAGGLGGKDQAGDGSERVVCLETPTITLLLKNVKAGLSGECSPLDRLAELLCAQQKRVLEDTAAMGVPALASLEQPANTESDWEDMNDDSLGRLTSVPPVPRECIATQTSVFDRIHVYSRTLKIAKRPTERTLMREAEKLVATLRDCMPAHRIWAVYTGARVEEAVTASWLHTRHYLGTIDVYRSANTDYASIVTREATNEQVHDPAFIVGDANVFALLKATHFFKKIHLLVTLPHEFTTTAHKRLAPVLADSIVSDLVDEQATFRLGGRAWAGPWTPATLERTGLSHLTHFCGTWFAETREMGVPPDCDKRALLETMAVKLLLVADRMIGKADMISKRRRQRVVSKATVALVHRFLDNLTFGENVGVALATGVVRAKKGAVIQLRRRLDTRVAALKKTQKKDNQSRFDMLQNLRDPHGKTSDRIPLSNAVHMVPEAACVLSAYDWNAKIEVNQSAEVTAVGETSFVYKTAEDRVRGCNAYLQSQPFPFFV